MSWSVHYPEANCHVKMACRLFLEIIFVLLGHYREHVGVNTHYYHIPISLDSFLHSVGSLDRLTVKYMHFYLSGVMSRHKINRRMASKEINLAQ